MLARDVECSDGDQFFNLGIGRDFVHWADKVADELIKRNPDLTRFTCASGITPSGPVHVGNLRDIATIWFVARALSDRGKNVRLVHSWDDYDRFRKVPKGVPPSYGEFLGTPISKVPDPEGQFPSYAARFEAAFEQSLLDLGIQVEFRYQAALYESGVYSSGIIKAVQARGEIFDIINSYRTQQVSAGERSRYLPIEIYCRACNKDTTLIEAIDYGKLTVSYRCSSCNNDETLDLTNARNVKLPWKIDWPMRWAHESVTFEPGGKDHATKGGSFWVASEIAKKVYGIVPPTFQPYEFVGLKGIAGKMSSSSGELLTPKDALAIYQPEVLLWIFAKYDPMRAFDLVVDKQIFQVYDSYDKALEESKKDSSSFEARAISLSSVRGRNVVAVPFRQLASFVDIVKGNCSALLDLLAHVGAQYTEQDIAERVEKAEAWLKRFAPDERVDLLTVPNEAYYATLSGVERSWIAKLTGYMRSGCHELQQITTVLYSIPEVEGTATVESQKRFFRILYRLLFNRDKGPRLATFFSALNPDRYLHLLSFGNG
ncbi:MAG TPA: lysine--tRNA ligase [Candidatus Dormibacteraeota bacterium]|jgi:lysyl-tRNA synthetase class 1|nr:lysine--tRNA ligase [Candidatus Dormibacteraeota bacterium]